MYLRTLLRSNQNSITNKPSGIVCGTVILANVGVWVWALLTLGPSPLLLGTAALAWTFGLRHGLDADHIVAIDTVTRKLMLSGCSPLRVGLFFSLGHSSVVILATLFLFVLPVHGWLERWHLIGGVFGTVVSGTFMCLTVITNAWLGFQQWRAIKQKKQIFLTDNPPLATPVGWLLRPFFTLIGRAWHMYPLGFVFGLGFDTASEIGLLGMTTLQAAHGVGLLGVLSFPLLFTAAMALVDTLDTLLMCRVYGWGGQNNRRPIFYNFVITLVSLFAAIGVGTAELGPLLLGSHLPSEFFSQCLNFVSDHFSAIGGCILVVFLLLWFFAQLNLQYSKNR